MLVVGTKVDSWSKGTDVTVEVDDVNTVHVHDVNMKPIQIVEDTCLWYV